MVIKAYKCTVSEIWRDSFVLAYIACTSYPYIHLYQLLACSHLCFVSLHTSLSTSSLLPLVFVLISEAGCPNSLFGSTIVVCTIFALCATNSRRKWLIRDRKYYAENADSSLMQTEHLKLTTNSIRYPDVCNWQSAKIVQTAIFISCSGMLVAFPAHA